MIFTKLPLKDRHNTCPRCNYMGCTRDSLTGHLRFHAWLNAHNLKRNWNAWLRSFSDLDYTRITDVEVDGIDTRDYPDFSDAFIASAVYKGREMTEAELERLNEDRDFVYEKVQARLY